MAELMFPDIAGSFQQGQRIGTLQRLQGESEQRRNTLASLAQQAYSAPQDQRQGILAQAIGVDPEAGFALEKDVQGSEDARTRSLVNAAKLLTSAPDGQRAALYQQMKPGLSQFGLQLPDQYDDSVAQTAQALVQAYGGGRAEGERGSVVGRRIVNPVTGQVIYESPQEQDYQWSDRAGAWIPKPMAGGGQQPAPSGSTVFRTSNGQPFDVSQVTDPTMRAEIMSNPDAYGLLSDAGGGSVELPQRDVTPQQYGGLSAIPVAGIGPKTEDQYQTLSAQEVAGLGLPSGTIAQRSPTGQVQIINKPRDLPTGGQVIDNGDGTTTYIPAGKITEGERNAAGFYDRMIAANEEIKRLEAAGYDPTSYRDYYTAGGEVLNPLATPEGQQYQQAKANWARANLRKESGAAIGVAEMDQEIKNYFPIPGDSPEVIAQKARNRTVTERAMRQAAGGGLAPPPRAAPQQQATAASGGWSIQRVD